MANIKDLIQSIESGDSSFDEKLAAINAMEETLVAMRAQEQEAIDDNVSLIVEAIRVMERKVEAQLEVARAIVPEKGEPGRDGKDGPAGRDGLSGRDGQNGLNGKDGQDGEDGVSVTDARIDFDGSLVITLSTGREINVGEVVAPDLAEKIKVISTMSTNTAIADITGGTIDNAVIGSTTRAAGTFTTLTATSTATLGGDATNPSLVAAAGAGNTRWLQVAGSAVGNVALTLQGTGNPTMQLITRGTGAFTFSTNSSASTEQMRVAHTASAVNYVQVTGAATGGAPTISAQGSDTNASMVIRAKGTGTLFLETIGASDVRLQPRGVRTLSVNGAVSGVNYFSMTGSSAGNTPSLAVLGSDTDIDLALTPKGTGNVRFGTYTGTILTPTGYVEIKDSGGTIRRLLVG
jgi:hypothetical protein